MRIEMFVFTQILDILIQSLIEKIIYRTENQNSAKVHF